MTFRSLTVLAFAFALGCSSAPEKVTGPGGATREEELNEVAAILRAHPGRGGNGPAKIADLAPYEQGGPLGYAAVKSGEIVVVWGAKMAGEGDTGSAEVIAYEKKTPTDGGLVMLVNGKVKPMTATEFAAAPKAKK